MNQQEFDIINVVERLFENTPFLLFQNDLAKEIEESYQCNKNVFIDRGIDSNDSIFKPFFRGLVRLDYFYIDSWPLIKSYVDGSTLFGISNKLFDVCDLAVYIKHNYNIIDGSALNSTLYIKIEYPIVEDKKTCIGSTPFYLKIALSGYLVIEFEIEGSKELPEPDRAPETLITDDGIYKYSPINIYFEPHWNK